MSQANADGPQTSSIEERKLAQEAEFKRLELILKEREIAAKEKELGRSRWFNPTSVSLAAAALALVGNLIVASINGRNSREIEQRDAQSKLIVQAISTGNAASACTNLISFMKLGLLDDPSGKIRGCEANLQSIPVLPSNGTSYQPPPDNPVNAHMNTVVTEKESGNAVEFDVAFTVPKPPLSPYPFNLITIYAYKTDNGGARSQDLSLPPIHGSWKEGDRVSFSAELPKKYLYDPQHQVFLRFCVGSADHGCLPSPSLLIPQV